MPVKDRKNRAKPVSAPKPEDRISSTSFVVEMQVLQEPEPVRHSVPYQIEETGAFLGQLFSTSDPQVPASLRPEIQRALQAQSQSVDEAAWAKRLGSDITAAND